MTIFLLSVSTSLTVLVMKMHFSGEHGTKVPNWLRRLVLVYLARIVRLGNEVTQSYKSSVNNVSQVVSCYSTSSCRYVLLHTLFYWCVYTFQPPSDSKVALLSSSSNGVSERDKRSRFHTGILGRIGHKDTTGSLSDKTWHTDTQGASVKGAAEQQSDVQNASMRTYFSSDNIEQTDNANVMPELLRYVKIICGEMQGKHQQDERQEHFRSEWRTIALVVDRLLLIVFFIVTAFTTAIIFINVPSRAKLSDFVDDTDQ